MGTERGREEGELIGKIRMAQRFLGRPVTLREALIREGVENLKAVLERSILWVFFKFQTQLRSQPPEYGDS